MSPSTGYVSFCGERFDLDPDEPFVIGRQGQVQIDDNPYLHRRFLVIGFDGGFWWIANEGTQLTATLADVHGTMHTWLAPGSRVPIVFGSTAICFAAGPTTYEAEVVLDEAPYVPAVSLAPSAGDTTLGRSSFTPDQLLMVIALCEDALRNGSMVATSLPTAAEAAQRLGWTATKFSRKLDNVCQKLERAGIRGLHGGRDGLALNRRARLVQYAITTRLVTRADLVLLDEPGDRR